MQENDKDLLLLLRKPKVRGGWKSVFGPRSPFPGFLPCAGTKPYLKPQTAQERDPSASARGIRGIGQGGSLRKPGKFAVRRKSLPNWRLFHGSNYLQMLLADCHHNFSWWNRHLPSRVECYQSNALVPHCACRFPAHSDTRRWRVNLICIVGIMKLATFVLWKPFLKLWWYRLSCFPWCIPYGYAAIHEANSSSKSFYRSASFMDFPWFQNQLSWAVPFLIAYTWAKVIIPKYHFRISFCLPWTSLSMCATLIMGQFKGLIPSPGLIAQYRVRTP